LTEEAYVKRWERKLALYHKAGIHPRDEKPDGKLIITRSGDDGPIDSHAVRKLIRE
jgi:hypothetical protein